VRISLYSSKELVNFISLFAAKILLNSCALRNMEPFVFISHARISLQHLSARSGSFLNISNGDAVQMKYILNLLLVPLDPLIEEDIDLIEYDDEEEIELEETSADTEESSCLSLFDFYFYFQISGSFFPSKVNDTFLESDEEFLCLSPDISADQN
jgi:hypothetical protein